MTAWLHTRKGKIVGDIVRQDDTWVQVRLREDAWADVRRRRRHQAGTVQTYRRTLLTAVEDTSDALAESSPESPKLGADS